MFTIYHSNKLDTLKSLLINAIKSDPLTDAFQQEVVLVEHPIMAEWLQIKLAEQFEIAANIRFTMPTTFIWEMYTRVLPGIPKESAFSRKSITWKLMCILPRLLDLPTFFPLQHYLSDDVDKRKIYQLASRVANLFEKYMEYRPHWLVSWQRGDRIDGLSEAQQWQAPLWTKLIEYTLQLGQSAWHLASLYSYFIRALDKAECAPISLPKRVFICGISALPPTYLHVLQALSRHTDIHLMLTNPCRYYWKGNKDHTPLSDSKDSKRCLESKGLRKKLFFDPSQLPQLFNSEEKKDLSNPLLASWGKLGRDYLSILSKLKWAQEIDAFVDVPVNNMLHAIQHDILELEDHAIKGSLTETLENSVAKRRLDPKDRSISFHFCYSLQREVEVLHDQLLTLLEEDQNLAPRDIIVMVADIDNYTPHIEAVFSNTSTKYFLPFVISDRKVHKVHPAVQAFISLLDLPKTRVTAEQVLTLLEVPALAARFSIGEEGVQLLRRWVPESGVRWGLDDDNVREFDVPATGQHTWKFGITRMLIGYAMDSKAGEWQGMLPYDDSSGVAAELVGNLADLLMCLRDWRRCLSEMRSLKEWLPVCRQLLDAFFVHAGETEVALKFAEQQWRQLIIFGLSARYLSKIPLGIIRDDLVIHLSQRDTNSHFLANQINFCRLMPMRSIPFQVVCLLGMNDGVYPRTKPSLGFDMMANQPKLGDRRQSIDDRYLFLEAILSANQKLYISFIGRSIKDNRKKHLSVLTSELLEYLEQSYCLLGDESLDIDCSAKRVSEHLVKRHSRMPFASENFLPDSEQQSYASEWLPAANCRIKTSMPFNQLLPPVYEQKISLDELQRFYRHPIRAFFQLRLGVSFDGKGIELPDEEPFTLDNLSRYRLNNQLLHTLIEGNDPRKMFQRVSAAGELPFGAFGKILWQKQYEEMTILAKKVRAERDSDYSLELDIEIDGMRIIGWMHHVQDDGLLRWRPATLSAVDGILLWLEHLVYCCMGRVGTSRFYGRKNSTWSFVSLQKDCARKYLAELIAGYQHGLCQPILLLHKSGWAWLNQCFYPKIQCIDWQEEVQAKARTKLLQAFYGDKYVLGEGKDPYVQRAFLYLDNTHLAQILAETERYLLPLAKYNII